LYSESTIKTHFQEANEKEVLLFPFPRVRLSVGNRVRNILVRKKAGRRGL
jgi:hypothetical protein